MDWIDLAEESSGRVISSSERQLPRRRSGGVEVCALSLTSVLDGNGYLTPRRDRIIPRKETRYPFYRRMYGFQGPVWTAAENLTPIEIRTPFRPFRSEWQY
jgi:hypothetical protein